MDSRNIATDIFHSGLEGVLPGALITDLIKLSGSVLSAGTRKILLSSINGIYIIGAGKAAAAMALAMENILGNRISGGQIVVKYGHTVGLNHVTVTEAGHPVPDSNGFKATGEILAIAEKASQDDLVICLLSGGGSALLTDYPEGSSQEEIIKLNDVLIKSGADIGEMNTVRKHLSRVKGGQLARAVFPATLLTLMLSDVPGDNPEVIASGPAYPDPSTFLQAIEVLEKYNLVSIIPEGLLMHLQKGSEGIIRETPKEDDPVFSRSYNLIIGNNQTAIEASKRRAEDLSIYVAAIDDSLKGDTLEAADYITDKAIRFKYDPNILKPVCLLFGGETTLKVTGTGLGGRNQHLALACAMRLRGHNGITVLAAGTDGTDGPTDAAGAVVDCDTYGKAAEIGAEPERFLNNFDSYNFFRLTGGHIITGPTMTNVMDLAVVIIE